MEVLCSSVESQKLVPTESNAFVQAVYHSYATHRPLVISPDMIWLLIVQGFSIHVQAHSEELRSIFVDHEGQINLDVKRDSYHPGNRDYWEGIFPDFSKQIETNTKEEVWSFAVPEFSTTTLVEKAAFEIALMDVMSPFFQYSMTIICGIPEISVEGTPEDWAKIKVRVNQLEKYDMDWWTDDLKKIIDEFEKASQGKINKLFWRNIFNEIDYTVDVGCGTDTKNYISGWVLNFFPYLKNGYDEKGEVAYIQNPLFKEKDGKVETYASLKLTVNQLPGGFSKAKVILNDNGSFTTLNFNAGFVGIQQDKETMALRPNIQWFISDLNIKPTQKELNIYNDYWNQ
ncbi:MAG: DUF4419 domain-containing protein [Lewinellaceae bacterium]|nr:DUF4419 domain-containing protein [Lewinellaceae bacterium]